mmetsp:Transcript_21943/g.65809  ORF Transcript_21943/g.65809 Transcript_21943/m.65809 type:complete len:219 (-) Transcript_21943:127-783(-)
MGVDRLMSVDMLPPSSSMPSDRGVTSSSTRSWQPSGARSAPPPVRPARRMAPCTAAPTATASSGCTVLHSSRRPSKSSCRFSWSFGTRVEPPTSTHSVMSDSWQPASRTTASTVCRQDAKRSLQRPSKALRVTRTSRSTSGRMFGHSTTASSAVDSSRLATSQAVRRRRMALALLLTSPANFCSSSFFFFSAALEPFWFLWPFLTFFSFLSVPARLRA